MERRTGGEEGRHLLSRRLASSWAVTSSWDDCEGMAGKERRGGLGCLATGAAQTGTCGRRDERAVGVAGRDQAVARFFVRSICGTGAGAAVCLAQRES